MAWEAEKPDHKALAETSLSQALINYFHHDFTLEDCEDLAKGCWRSVKEGERSLQMFCAMRGIE